MTCMRRYASDGYSGIWKRREVVKFFTGFDKE